MRLLAQMVGTSRRAGRRYRRLWRVPDIKPTHVLMIGSAIGGMSFSPDTKQIVTWSEDKTIRVWDVASGSEIRRLAGHTGFIQYAEWSPDGTRIVSRFDGRDSPGV